MAFGVQDDITAWSQAGGCGGKARRGESQVQKATLAGAHGIEGMGLASAADTLDGGFRGKA